MGRRGHCHPRALRCRTLDSLGCWVGEVSAAAGRIQSTSMSQECCFQREGGDRVATTVRGMHLFPSAGTAAGEELCSAASISHHVEGLVHEWNSAWPKWQLRLSGMWHRDQENTFRSLNEQAHSSYRGGGGVKKKEKHCSLSAESSSWLEVGGIYSWFLYGKESGTRP